MDTEAMLFFIYVVFITTLPLHIEGLYYIIMPPLETKTLREKVRCIGGFMGIEVDEQAKLPTVHVLTQTEVMQVNPEWGNYDTVWGTYNHGWLRIFLNRVSRQDILYHELAHHVQFLYGRIPEKELDMEREAWAAARHLLLVYHPMRYQLAMMLFGLSGIWAPSDVVIR